MSANFGEQNQCPAGISLGRPGRICVLQLERAEACRIHAHREKTTRTAALFWSSMFLTIRNRLASAARDGNNSSRERAALRGSELLTSNSEFPGRRSTVRL